MLELNTITRIDILIGAVLNREIVSFHFVRVVVFGVIFMENILINELINSLIE